MLFVSAIQRYFKANMVDMLVIVVVVERKGERWSWCFTFVCKLS